MRLMVYSVYDAASEAFLPPFFMRNKGEAIRGFMDACNDPSRFLKHVGDYTLFELGAFDDSNGLLIANEVPFRLMSGLEAGTKDA